MTKRIESIDTLRGVALLGLMTMNLVAMSMPIGAYLNPLAYGKDDFLSQEIFAVLFVFADQKFMGIFSLLFGASVMLLIERLRERGRNAAWVHYRRNFLLIILGLAHGIYLWEGDVLFIYGVAALFLYPIYRARAGTQVFIAALLLVSASYYGGEFNGEDALAEESSREQVLSFYRPDTKAISDSKQLYLGRYKDLVEHRLGTNDDVDGGESTSDDSSGVSALIELELFILLSSFCRAFGMMCLGMALYQCGFLQGRWSVESYKKTAVLGLGLGLPVLVFAWFKGHASGWALAAYFSGLGVYSLNILGSVFVAVAYSALIVQFCLRAMGTKIQRRLQAVGQMALSNYLIQSLIGTTLFYGYGLGLYGQLARWQLLIVFLAIASFQLWYSPLYLRYFRQGPVEYLWRCLTYFQAPPFRRDL